MMIRLTLISLALAIPVGAPAIAQSQSQAQPAPAPAPAPKVKKICRTEMDTGSIIARRTCHTQQEWNEASTGTDSVTLDQERQRQQTSQQMVQGVGAPN